MHTVLVTSPPFYGYLITSLFPFSFERSGLVSLMCVALSAAWLHSGDLFRGALVQLHYPVARSILIEPDPSPLWITLSRFL